jgi:serine/threonine protein kinase
LRDERGRPVVAGYEVQEEAGAGPTGVAAWRARQVVVSRPVLLKVVFAREDTGQVAWGSLRGEAAALGRLSHPNIVQIFEAGERERQLFYNAVELVEGPILAQLLADKPLPLRQVMLLVEVLARAVHHAHERGIVHRSLKPASVLLQPVARIDPRKKGEAPEGAGCALHGAVYLPRITDWGLARRPVEGDVNDAELQGGPPCYLAPEQAWGRAKEIGPLTDVYGLGAILYECLTGRPPFREESPAQTLDALQVRDPVPPARLRRIPADLDAVCRRSLAKQPRRRYASALDLADDLRRCRQGRPVQARPTSAAARAGRWVRRHFQAVGVFLLGAFAARLLLGHFNERPPTPSASQATVTQLQADLARARAAVTDAQRRADEAGYFGRIALADRALEGGDGGRARELLNLCPPQVRR